MPRKKHEEASRADWERITLRLPPDLYRAILQKAGALSANAAIVRRLEDSFQIESLPRFVRLAAELAPKSEPPASQGRTSRTPAAQDNIQVLQTEGEAELVVVSRRVFDELLARSGD